MADGILIGGSPSTGSSALVHILNRHPALLAGPETYLFMHPGLYTDWERHKTYLLKTSKFGGLKSRGWFKMNGADLLQPFYGQSTTSLLHLIAEADTFSHFAGAYFQSALQKAGARIWVEKSPSNALCFDHFLHIFPEGKVVHTTRDPYDAIASLVARGLSPFSATAFYLINTAFAIKKAEDSRYHLLKYEEWVASPEKVLKPLLQSLGLKWRADLIRPEAGEEVRMEGWLHNEKAALSTRSIGRFYQLTDEQQRHITCAVRQMRINPRYRKVYGLEVGSIQDLCAALGYPEKPSVGHVCSQLKMARLAARFFRLTRFYPHWGRCFPITLSGT